MTIEQCYSAIESNYEEVLGRFAGNKMLVEKFARKFLDDPSYQTLVDTMDKADYEEAFRAAHTLKGVCANLGFTQLFKVSSDLTEELRGGAPDEAKLPELLEKVSSEYKKPICYFHCWKADRLLVLFMFYSSVTCSRP